jgi:hypothetical protein
MYPQQWTAQYQGFKNIIDLWNKLAKKEGFSGIHFMRFLGPFNNQNHIDGIDGYVDFQPGYSTSVNYNDIISEDNNNIFDENNNKYDEEIYLNKNIDIKKLIESKIISNGYEHYCNIGEKERKFRTSKFNIFDGIKLYETIVNSEKKYNEEHRGICTNWNNTPRRNYTDKDYSKYPNYYKNINPILFEEYSLKILNKIMETKNKDLDFLFISAWNEWNEQAILEPNNEDGYEYLKSISNKYLEFYNYPKYKKLLNICHKGGGTEKYMNDIKKIYLEYDIIDFEYYNIDVDYSNIYKDIDIVHINSILFNNLKHNYFYFLNTYFKNSKKILTIHDYQWLFYDKPNIIKEDFYNLLKINKKNLPIDHFEKLLSICTIIIFPSNNIFKNYEYFIDLEKYKNKIYIVSHFDKIINQNFLVIPKIDKDINIAYVGYFVNHKGSKLIKNLSEKFITYKNYNIKFHIYGNINSEININNYNKNVIFYNEYNDKEIINILHKNNIHGIVHLSIFEESYCYSLTNSINSGIPILYLDRGAFSERLSKKNKYFSTNIEDINDNFLNFIEYLVHNNNIYDFYKLNDSIQPNKWYLENY